MNGRFEFRWTRDGVERVTEIRGLSELSEFVRNCDAYDRMILEIVNVTEGGFG